MAGLSSNVPELGEQWFLFSSKYFNCNFENSPKSEVLGIVVDFSIWLAITQSYLFLESSQHCAHIYPRSLNSLVMWDNCFCSQATTFCMLMRNFLAFVICLQHEYLLPQVGICDFLSIHLSDSGPFETKWSPSVCRLERIHGGQF